MAMKKEEQKGAIKEEQVKIEKKENDPNDDNNNEPEFEYEYWTSSGQLKLHCIGDCDGILKSDVYGQLAQTIYAIEGLPKKMECKGPNCDTILEKRKLCFYCPHGVIKGSGHVGMVWCRFCAYKKALKIHTRKVHQLDVPVDKAAFDKSVIIFGFGSIERLQ